MPNNVTTEQAQEWKDNQQNYIPTDGGADTLEYYKGQPVEQDANQYAKEKLESDEFKQIFDGDSDYKDVMSDADAKTSVQDKIRYDAAADPDYNDLEGKGVNNYEEHNKP